MKVVTFEAMQEVSKLLATKAQVTKQIEAAGLAEVTPATTEEVLALFQESTEPTA